MKQGFILSLVPNNALKIGLRIEDLNSAKHLHEAGNVDKRQERRLIGRPIWSQLLSYKLLLRAVLFWSIKNYTVFGSKAVQFDDSMMRK